MSAAIRTSKRPSGAAVSASALRTWSEPGAASRGVFGLELDAHDLDVLALLSAAPVVPVAQPRSSTRLAVRGTCSRISGRARS